MQEHQAKGPNGGTYKVLTLTEAGARKAQECAVEQGFDKEQQTWTGLVKKGELRHDSAVYRAAQIEQRRLVEQGASIQRVRIDAELKKAGGPGHRNGAGQRRQGGGGRGASQGRSGVGATRQRWSRSSIPTRRLNIRTSRAAAGASTSRLPRNTTAASTIAAKAQAGFQIHGKRRTGQRRDQPGARQSRARRRRRTAVAAAARGGRDGSMEL